MSRSDWNALIDHLEDIEDMAAVAARRAKEATDGVAAIRRDYLTGDELRRLLDWDSPVKIWREKRGLSQRELAGKAGVSPSYLAEIETGQKPGSADALLALAHALGTSMESLVSTNRLQIAFSHLKQLLEGGASEAEAVREGDNLLAEFKERGAAPLDMAELKSHLRQLAASYDDAGMTRKHDVLSKVIRRIPI